MTFSKRSLLACSLSLLLMSLFLSACRAPEPSSEGESVEEKPPADSVQISPEAVSRLKLQTVIVRERNTSNPLQVSAIVLARQDHVYPISSLATGRLVQDNVQIGQSIHTGQTLALVQNTDVAKIQAGYLHELHSNEIEIQQARIKAKLAHQNYLREKMLLNEEISPRRDYQTAEANEQITKAALAGQEEHRTHIRSEAKALLGVYGLQPNASNVERIFSTIPLTAPHGGTLTQKLTSVGSIVFPDKVLYEITDLSEVWLEMSIFPQDLRKLQNKLPVKFTLDSQPGKVFQGHIDYVPALTQNGTQTVQVRATMNNQLGLLRPGMMGITQIAQPVSKPMAFLPQSALQHYGREFFVFLPTAQAGVYRKQRIQPGATLSDGVLVESGLVKGQQVVSQGSFALKAELLKDLFTKAD